MRKSKLFRIFTLALCLCFLLVNTVVIAEYTEDTQIEESDDEVYDDGYYDEFGDDTHDSTGKTEEENGRMEDVLEDPTVGLDDMTGKQRTVLL